MSEHALRRPLTRRTVLKAAIAAAAWQLTPRGILRAGAADAVRIGFDDTLTGTYAALGKNTLIGCQLALEQINAKGGIIVRDVFQVVASMRDEGISVLLVEQNVRAAVEIADRVVVLDDGRVVHEARASDLGADEQRVRALAGASAGTWEGIA